MQPEELPPVLTMNDVARYLRIGRTVAYELAHRPDFPAVRIGRLIRVNREAFLRWCEGPTKGYSQFRCNLSPLRRLVFQRSKKGVHGFGHPSESSESINETKKSVTPSAGVWPMAVSLSCTAPVSEAPHCHVAPLCGQPRNKAYPSDLRPSTPWLWCILVPRVSTRFSHVWGQVARQWELASGR